MAELHSNLYFHHPEPKKHSLLISLFDSDDRDEQRHIAAALNPDNGSQKLDVLLQEFDDQYGDCLSVESVIEMAGYGAAHMVNGGSGDYIVGRTVKFVHELCEGVHVQAWGCGDDDPWEYWFKVHDGKVIRYDDEPWSDDEEDARLLATIYRWWHTGMPAQIKEGILNDSEGEVAAEELSDEEYEDWLQGLLNRVSSPDDGVSQGIEPAIGKDDVKEILGAVGEIFSMFKTAAGSEKNPQKNAFDAETVTEELVMEAFEDINNCERNLDLDGAMKHYAKSLQGQTEVLDDSFSAPIPVSYSLYKMGMAALLKEKAQYKCDHDIQAYKSLDDGRAELHYHTKSQFIEPGTQRFVEMLTDDKVIWDVLDGKLQVVEIYSKEMES